MPAYGAAVRSRRVARLPAAVRFGLSLWGVASVWAFVVGLAVATFWREAPGNRWDIVPKEVFGFAYGFAVAGTITGCLALTVLGRGRWAVGLGVVGGVLIAASVAALRWWVFRVAARNVGWAQREWDEAFERLGPSVAVGAAVAVLISAFVVAARFLTPRMTSWRFSLVVAVGVAILGLWAFPAFVSLVVDQAIPYLRSHYGYRYDEALRGAASGAGPGALVGAVVAALFARRSRVTGPSCTRVD